MLQRRFFNLLSASIYGDSATPVGILCSRLSLRPICCDGEATVAGCRLTIVMELSLHFHYRVSVSICRFEWRNSLARFIHRRHVIVSPLLYQHSSVTSRRCGVTSKSCPPPSSLAIIFSCHLWSSHTTDFCVELCYLGLIATVCI